MSGPITTLPCRKCGTAYSDADFLAAHPGPFQQDALKLAKRIATSNCAGCPTYTISRQRPPLGKN
jgi:hypothetical protein